MEGKVYRIGFVAPVVRSFGGWGGPGGWGGQNQTPTFVFRTCNALGASSTHAIVGLDAMPATWETAQRYTDGPVSAFAR